MIERKTIKNLFKQLESMKVEVKVKDETISKLQKRVSVAESNIHKIDPTIPVNTDTAGT